MFSELDALAEAHETPGDSHEGCGEGQVGDVHHGSEFLAISDQGSL